MSDFAENAKKKHKEIKPEVLNRAKEKIDKVRAKLLLKQPFYGVLLSMADITATAELPTLATDGVRIFFNPEFISKLTEQECNGVMLHEISHCVYLHCTTKRRLNRDRQRWNIACDYAINLEINAMGNQYQLPKGVLLDNKYSNMNAEQIYDSLPKDISGLSTLDTHIELPDGAEDWDEMEDKIISAYEMSKDFYEEGKNQGKMPAGIRRWIDKMRNSKVKWERIFHRYIGQALAKDDYSYTKCNRRYLAHDIYLPDLRSHIIGNVVIGVDTSGSITKDILEQFSAELAKISHLVDEVTIMTCDAKVNEVVKITKMQQFMDKVQFLGGGGTDFKPVFNKVHELRLMPELLIYLTDTYGDAGKKAPPYPVVWCVTVEPGQDYDLPFGLKVYIPREKK